MWDNNSQKRLNVSALATLLVCISCLAPSAARNPSLSNHTCPTISCESSTGVQPIQFTVDGGSNNTTYLWTVSSGGINSGQGTNQISVSGVPVGQSCEATVIMTGIPAGCTVTKLSCTTTISANLVCPTVSVSSADSTVQEGSPAVFTANIKGVVYALNWSVSAGTITSGQGTSSITVSTDTLGGRTITATVELGGLDPSCVRTAESSVAVISPPKSFKFDEFTSLGVKAEQLRLDKFADALLKDPSAQAYVITNGRSNRTSQWRAANIQQYLVRRRRIDRARIVGVDNRSKGTFRTELWIVPAGASPPGKSTSTPEKRNHPGSP